MAEYLCDDCGHEEKCEQPCPYLFNEILEEHDENEGSMDQTIDQLCSDYHQTCPTNDEEHYERWSKRMEVVFTHLRQG